MHACHQQMHCLWYIKYFTAALITCTMLTEAHLPLFRLVRHALCRCAAASCTSAAAGARLWCSIRRQRTCWRQRHGWCTRGPASWPHSTATCCMACCQVPISAPALPCHCLRQPQLQSHMALARRVGTAMRFPRLKPARCGCECQCLAGTLHFTSDKGRKGGRMRPLRAGWAVGQRSAAGPVGS